MDTVKKRTRILSIILGVTLLIEVIYIVLKFDEGFDRDFTLFMIFASSAVYAFVFTMYRKMNHAIKLHFWMTLISVVIVYGGIFLPFMNDSVFLLYLLWIILYATIYAILYKISDNTSGFMADSRLIVSTIVMFILKSGPFIFLSLAGV